MKKIIVSLMLAVFMFSAFYPAIYAAEDVINNEVIDENQVEESVTENNNSEVKSDDEKEELEDENSNELKEEILSSEEDNKQEENIVASEKDEQQEEAVSNENVVEDQQMEPVQQDPKVEVEEKTENENITKKDTIVTYKTNQNVGVSLSGKMYIESPTEGQQLILPNSNTIIVKGWAVSTDTKAILKVYLDNNYVKNVDKRIERADVNQAVTQYGGTTTTPKAGFEVVLDISTLTAGNHTIKVEQVAENGTVIVSETRKIVIKQTAYKGKLYVESPSVSSSYTLPDNNTMQIKGWAVSDDIGAYMLVYINGKEASFTTTRQSRGDVDTLVSPSYGGAKSTPKAGFTINVDISGLTNGTYEVTVMEVSRYHKIMCSSKMQISVAKRNYKGKLYVESPSVSSSYKLPENETMQIKGWAVSDDIGAYMLVYINGKEASFTTTRESRGDVDTLVSPSYGGTKSTPKAGFTINVDISGLTDGTYEVTVMEVSRYHKIMCSSKMQISVTRQTYTGKMYTESPTNNQQLKLPDSNIITVKGWAVSTDTNAVLKVYLDNKYIKNADKRIERVDVNKAVTQYGGTKTTPKAGFEAALDISTLTVGQHTIKVEQVSRYGKVISTETRTIVVKQTAYKGKLNVESPSISSSYKLPDNGTMQIKGWAVSDDIGAYMLVYINGKGAPFTTTREARGDVDTLVSPSYGGTKTTPKAGFTINVDISGLTDGTYEVTIMEVSRYHKIMCSSKMKITVATPTYEGNMNVDSPVQNRRYHSGNLEISGWALSQDKNDSIKVYLDDKFVAVAERRERADVFGVYNKNEYGGQVCSPFPGFYSVIETTGLREGMHTVKIVNYSGYGKKIQSREVKFMISNTQTWGIDVSHHQGNIDWNTVRNQGVDFAILKIGEYRESSGRIIVDSSFATNYSECKRLGIAVGGYFYSYAFDPNEASHEAAACLSVISGKSFELPIFLDIEDDIIINAVNRGATNVENLTNGAITFCSIMNQNGYQSGVYASKNFYKIYLNTPLLESYNIWLAHYTQATDYSGKYDLWQYSSSGSIPGINGAVDLNWCFRRYY